MFNQQRVTSYELRSDISVQSHSHNHRPNDEFAKIMLSFRMSNIMEVKLVCTGR